MILDARFTINEYNFDSQVVGQLANHKQAKELWPLVYILSSNKHKEAYIGETTDTFQRMKAHLGNNQKKKLTTVHLVASEFFNKSATLDIEANLIKYMAADGQFKLLNANLGLANHNFYQKQELYWTLFENIWHQLRNRGVTRHSIEYIDNSDLFKYSPYKSLSQEQCAGLVQILRALAGGASKNLVLQGGAGTGKTILAIFLFKLLNTSLGDLNFEEFGEQEVEIVTLVRQIKLLHPDLKMALVIPMASFRKTIQKTFSGINGLSSKMVIGPSEVVNAKYDLLVVDEAHRLRRRMNLASYFASFDKASQKLGFDRNIHTELDWVLRQSKRSVFFYDPGQSIKPSDVSKEVFDRLLAQLDTEQIPLATQLRVKGGAPYVSFLDKLLQVKLPPSKGHVQVRNYELQLFDSLTLMVQKIKERDQEVGLSRLIAGYAWPWVSKDPKKPKYRPYDIEEDGVQLKWNSKAVDWINSKNAVHEVGCIHTTQGYDLNYSGIIVGPEIGFDEVTQEIVVYPDRYQDRNGKATIKDPKELRDFIVNIYKTIMLRGIRGTYIYVCDPALKTYLSRYIPKVSEVEARTPLQVLRSDGVSPFEDAVPLYSLSAAAGGFSMVQKVENHEWVRVPKGIRISSDHFACRVVGDSMDLVIPNGALCLFKRYTGGSRDGLIVLAEYTDFVDQDAGSTYTVKEYQSKKERTETGWQHLEIRLRPKSSQSSYSDLVIDPKMTSQLRIIGFFEGVISLLES
ncbi:MAG: DUF2075 domain-containing protein [Saprospiraceae bacterium]|nr:DUF2075 domain-containing protein [Saprospiraceae bacterium]